MGILATDILIKTMVEAALYDLRKNTYLLDDVFGGMAPDPLSKVDYGYKEVDRAKKWFLENDIKVFFPFRMDSPTMPCITIALTQSSEMQDRASLADEGGEAFEEHTNPRNLDRRIQKVYRDFTPASYDAVTGVVGMPVGTDPTQLTPGQFLVSCKSNKAYVIKSTAGITFAITPGIQDDFSMVYVAPMFSVWNVHRELTFLNESYNIGVHAQSDPVATIWLRQLTMYMLLRYKEAYLENRGFEISSVQAGEIMLNQSFDMDRVFSCYISLSGQVEASWIKYIAPKFDKATGKIKIIDGPATPTDYIPEVQSQGWIMEADGATPKKGKRHGP